MICLIRHHGSGIALFLAVFCGQSAAATPLWAQVAGGTQQPARQPADGEPAAEEQISGEENLLPESNPDFDNEAGVAAFETALNGWRTTLADMREVMIRFNNGPPQEAEGYRQRYRELEMQGREQFDEAMAAAIELLKNAPRENYVAAQFLLVAVHYRFNKDWYELTGEAVEQLRRVKAKDDRLAEIAGVSFFATNQYDKAEPYLREAMQAGNLAEINQGILESLDACRVLWPTAAEQRAADAERDDLPRVRLLTTRGEIVLELFEDAAPNTVANFIRMVEDGLLENLPFYQVISGRIALVGESGGSAVGGEYCLADETQSPDRRYIFRGSLAMAKLPDPIGESRLTIPNTASQQFFFAFQPLVMANAEHTVFGRIIEGMSTFSLLTRLDPSKKEENAEPVNPDRILEAEVIRQRDHSYEPQVIRMSPLQMAEQGGVLSSENKPGD